MRWPVSRCQTENNTEHRLVPVLVSVIQRPPRRSHKQFAWVIGHNRSTLTRNLNERRVIVQTTPMGRINYLSTSRNDRKHEQCGSRECTGNFHWKASLWLAELTTFRRRLS